MAESPQTGEAGPGLTPWQGRLLVVLAAVMWSSGGFFAKAPIFENWPPESRGALLAFWRALFAGSVLVPLVRKQVWQPRLLPMAVCFAAMNVTYLTAMALTTAANAIWLQSTSPIWVTLFSVLILHIHLRRHDALLLGFGMAGVAVILYFEARGQNPVGVSWGLASGVCYAGVVLFLRGFRDVGAIWLVVVNHLFTAVLLLPYVLWQGIWPSLTQLMVLFGFGLIQMGLPYALFARGLTTVTGPEAAGIVLLEPVLLPIWVFIAWGEWPAPWTIFGGGLILAGMVLRYLPAFFALRRSRFSIDAK